MGRGNVREEAYTGLDRALVVAAMSDEELPQLPDDIKEAMKGWSLSSFRRMRELMALGGRRTVVFQLRVEIFYKRRGTDVRKKPDTNETLTGWIETQTPRAILFHSDMDPDEEGKGWWIPLSQITRMDELGGESNRYEIDVKSWLIEKNGYQ